MNMFAVQGQKRLETTAANAKDKQIGGLVAAFRDSISAWVIHTLLVEERVLAGAEGLVSDTISWMASRSLSRWSGLLMPISRWISVSDRFAMIAPLFTFDRQAATYQAGIPTHSSSQDTTVGPSQEAKGRP